MKKVRFGIVGTGTIAHKFASTAPMAEEIEVIGAASRDLEKAKAFGDKHHLPKAYGSYEELFADPDVDAVYVATPHSHHKENSIAAMNHGKHVLCEKAMTICEADALEMFQAAEKNNVFLMEAMWTRFFPTTEMAKEWVRQGRIGDIRLLTASFGFRCNEQDTGSRLLNPALAGGAMFDVGVYVIEFMLDFMAGKKLADCHAFLAPASTGVDGVDAMSFRFEDGALAQLTAAVTCSTEHWGIIYGTKGYIKLGPNVFAPSEAQLFIGGEPADRYSISFDSGFEFEMRHAAGCILRGERVSTRMPPEDTLACARIFDKLLAQFRG